MNDNNSPTPVKKDQKLASYIAMVVRNAMEDFHCEHLSDDQMRQLNPIIRNAICTALHAFNCYEQSDAAARYVDFNLHMIPTYWEPPELTLCFKRSWSEARSRAFSLRGA